MAKDKDDEIKQLKNDLQQDLQFNLPTEIALPTLYEVRRVNQGTSGTGLPGGSIGYQDNRNVDINITVADSADLPQVEEILYDALSSPSRFGTQTRRY